METTDALTVFMYVTDRIACLPVRLPNTQTLTAYARHVTSSAATTAARGLSTELVPVLATHAPSPYLTMRTPPFSVVRRRTASATKAIIKGR